MNASNRIIIATNNKGKLKEIQEILFGIKYDILGLTDIGSDINIQENGQTYSENALIKAQEVYRIVNEIVISDDSGLEVDALGGRPGIHSARYASNTDDRIKKLLKEMKDIPLRKRNARFVCVACLYINKDRYIFFHGRVDGVISNEPKGTNGFGFDPIFFLPEYNMTMAELPLEIKNKISHRAKAFTSIKDFLLKESGNLH